MAKKFTDSRTKIKKNIATLLWIPTALQHKECRILVTQSQQHPKAFAKCMSKSISQHRQCSVLLHEILRDWFELTMTALNTFWNQPHCHHLWVPDKRKALYAGQHTEKDLFLSIIFYPASISFLNCHLIYNLMKNNYLL